MIDRKGPWYVFWRTPNRNGTLDWSLLHRTNNHISTMCNKNIKPNIGIRQSRKLPEKHVLSICQMCNSAVLTMKNH